MRGDAVQIDLRDRLRVAADALATDFDGTVTSDHAEALVFSSAEGLLAKASVTEFVPILAERRARLAVRSGATAPAPTPHRVPAEVPEVADDLPIEAFSASADPLIAIGVEQLDRLRDRLDLVRVRVADWRAELHQR